ncbi:MAG TPA: Panacea domain-containing protein [Kofleriaceae bacterium]|nr:Panacea domain-containing protein [Kofleriaceae bacterium]
MAHTKKQRTAGDLHHRVNPRGAGLRFEWIADAERVRVEGIAALTSLRHGAMLSVSLQTLNGIVRFQFNDAKTAQAAAHLLGLSGGTMSYMVLIKLMYLADRQMLLDHGRPITGDRPFSMKHGPVLSNVLDFITHGPTREPDSAWFTLIGEPRGYDVSLKVATPPTDELSRYELQLLQQTYEKYGGIGKANRWDLVDLLHKILPEWKDPGGSASRIEYVDILRAEDWSDEDIALLKSQADSAWFLSSLG